MSQAYSSPRLLKRKQVQDLTTLSKTSIYKLVGEGTFPKPIKLGAKAVAWRESDIIDWIRRRVEISRGERP